MRHPEAILNAGVVIIKAVVYKHGCLLHAELVHLHLYLEIL